MKQVVVPLRCSLLLLTCAVASGQLNRRPLRTRTLELDNEESQVPPDFIASMSMANFNDSMSFHFDNPSTGDDDDDDDDDDDHDELMGTSWTAVQVPLKRGIVAPITIEFDFDNNVSGSTGCNRYRGAIEFSEGNLTFAGRFQTTRIYCQGLMGQERNYLNFLKMNSYFYDIIEANENSELVLYDSVTPGPQGTGAVKGEVVARFAKTIT